MHSVNEFSWYQRRLIESISSMGPADSLALLPLVTDALLKLMSNAKERQSTDSKQGGEGTNSLHNKGWEALTKNIDSIENTVDGGKELNDGTK